MIVNKLCYTAAFELRLYTREIPLIIRITSYDT